MLPVMAGMLQAVLIMFYHVTDIKTHVPQIGQAAPESVEDKGSFRYPPGSRYQRPEDDCGLAFRLG